MFEVDDHIQSLSLVAEQDELSLYEYSPTLFKLTLVPLEVMSLIRRCRLLSEKIRGGYKIYYLAQKGKLVGYCVVTPGGRRLKCTTKKDVVIGPYFICPNSRGKGLSKKMIKLVLAEIGPLYVSAYDWIYQENVPSIRCMEACGFRTIGRLDVVGKFRLLKESANGPYVIMKYDFL